MTHATRKRAISIHQENPKRASERGRRFRVVAAALGAALGLACLVPATSHASGLCPYVGNGLAGTYGQSYQANVTSNGATPITSWKIELIYYGDFWDTPFGEGIEAASTTALNYLVKPAFWNRLYEYGGGASFSGSTALGLLGIQEFVSATNDDNLTFDLKAAIADGSLPRNDSHTLYVAILPPGASIYFGGGTFSNGSGYHYFTQTSDGRPLYYSAITMPSGASAVDGMLVGHEVSEAATDQDGTGVIDWQFGGEGEIGDLCNGWVTPIDGPYFTQTIWSQSVCRCVAFRNPLSTTFPGDGAATHAVYRNGLWFIWENPETRSGYSFGSATDIPVPGDYDGDGYADIAYYTPSTHVWHILSTSSGVIGTGAVTTVNFGAAGVKPLPADYLGTGFVSPAYYNSTTLRWAVKGLQTFTVPAAYKNWRPVPADYDGDMKADPAFWDPKTGTWVALGSTAGYTQWFTVTVFGGGADGSVGGADIPMPADYDGDGYVDPGVFRPSDPTTGTSTFRWFNYYANGPVVISFGAPGDIPVRGDFDRDWRDDYALFRPSSGQWFWMSAATQAWGPVLTWGISTDKPVLAHY